MVVVPKGGDPVAHGESGIVRTSFEIPLLLLGMAVTCSVVEVP